MLVHESFRIKPFVQGSQLLKMSWRHNFNFVLSASMRHFVLLCVKLFFFIGNIKQHQQQTNNNNKPSCISNMDDSDENISKKEEDRNDEDVLRQPLGC